MKDILHQRNNSFLFYYYGKIEMISNYKSTFGLKECKSTSVTQKQMPSQCVQYGNTVHLFIGTGRSPCKITPMLFTFANDSIVIRDDNGSGSDRVW
jgi:hypothetical protein